MSSPGSDRQTMPAEGAPYGWLQWKGTGVCMDFYCVCGHNAHIDDDFVYYVRCAECGKTYFMNGHVEAVELSPEEAAQVKREGKVTVAQ